MIIGNNTNKDFSNILKNPTIENERIKQHTNVVSKEEMSLKSFNMLEERYRNGLISLEEYTRKCNEIRKQQK